MSDEEERPQEDQPTPELREGENPVAGKVTGYRNLTDAELQLVNDLKSFGPVLEQVFADVIKAVEERHKETGLPPENDYRAIALGKTNVQQGFMWLIRAVTAPQGFV